MTLIIQRGSLFSLQAPAPKSRWFFPTEVSSGPPSAHAPSSHLSPNFTIDMFTASSDSDSSSSQKHMYSESSSQPQDKKANKTLSLQETKRKRQFLCIMHSLAYHFHALFIPSAILQPLSEEVCPCFILTNKKPVLERC